MSADRDSLGGDGRAYDVVVVGAGTAGAATALLCAERGLRVLCIDRRPLELAGARWVNGVPERAFIEAGLAVPVPPELRARNVPFHLIAGHGPERVTITEHGALEVDMRLLVARLQADARSAGARLVGEVSVSGMDEQGVHTSRGRVRTRVAVDASGLSGARLLDQPRVAPAHICTAAQQVFEVRDRRAALDFCERHAARPGEIVCFTGIAGGFSIINVRTDGDEASILTGSIPAVGHPGGKAILNGFRADNPWLGKPVFGGARAVPLRRPYDRLASDRIALIGDAGCQIFPAHGSGIAIGLLAARVLADALASGAGLRGYEQTFQRQHGGVLAAFDLFRRFSQTLCVADLKRMMQSGLMEPAMARAAIVQRLPEVTLSGLAGKLGALTRAPDMAWRMAATFARIPIALGLYARYPADPAQLPRWSRLVARLFDEPADIQS